MARFTFRFRFRFRFPPGRNSTKGASGAPTKAADAGTVLYDILPASATAAEADKPNPNDIYAVVPAKVALPDE